MVKVKGLPLDKALRRVSPELEKAVRTAMKRSLYIGLVLGVIVGFVLSAVVISFHVSDRLVKNAQECDLFAIGPVRPELPPSAPQLCWIRVDVYDANHNPGTVFVCPTKYNLQLQYVPASDVNADVVSRLYDACVSLRTRLSSVTVGPEVNSEVNG